MDTLIVIIIVGLSVAYLIKKACNAVFRHPESSCNCGCSGCSSEATCTDISKTLSGGNPE